MSKRGESIFKQKDVRWEGRFMYPESLLPRGNPAENSASFLSLSEEWLHFMQPKIKESTFIKYRNSLKIYILPTLGKKTLNSFTNSFLESYIQYLFAAGSKKGSGLAPKTIADILSIIRNILQFAANTGRIPPCDASSIKVKQHMKKMRVLSRREQEQLCRYLCSDLNAHNIGILLCLFTGLRVGEICALRWENISLDEQVIHICRTMQRIQTDDNPKRRTKIIISTPKSSCSIRTIPLPECLIKIIRDYQSTEEGYFLTGSNQKIIEPRTMQNHFKKALEKSSVEPANFHALRHTFATRCIELGFDVKSLSEILGHASVNITMNRYVHPSMELKQANMQQLCSLFTVK